MIERIYRGDKNFAVREPKRQYAIELVDSGDIFDCDEFDELAEIMTGPGYVDADFFETRKIMRIKTAQAIGMKINTLLFLNSVPDTWFDEDDEDEEIFGDDEKVIVYDEAIGKIPFSYTGNVDYDIHGDPELIRVECARTFIYSLVKLGYINVWERDAAGEYKNYREMNLADEIERELIPFKKITERVPNHKKLGEA